MLIKQKYLNKTVDFITENRHKIDDSNDIRTIVQYLEIIKIIYFIKNKYDVVPEFRQHLKKFVDEWGINDEKN